MKKNYIESDKINTELWKLDFKKKNFKNINSPIYTQSLKQELQVVIISGVVKIMEMVV